MKSIYILVFIGLIIAPVSAQKSVVITNNTSSERIDETFVIKRNQFTSVKSGLLPVLKNAGGEWVACQADDLDKNGSWDELAFIYSLQAKETATLSIEWLSAKNYPKFIPRTNARLGKMTTPGKVVILPADAHGKNHLARGEGYPYQTDGPAWENDKMGFRHYFDGRNVRDVFGKRTSEMVMDTVGIRADGTPGDTYHVLHGWGRDVMNGARSIGLGGIALQTPDSLIRLGVPIEETTDNIDSTRYKLVVNGPVRSIFKLEFVGWHIYGKKVNVYETMTIWGGKFGYENVIKTSPLPKGTYLVTGIVNSLNDKPYVQEKIGKYEMMTTHDKQTYDKTWYLGMSLLIDQGNWVDTFEAPKSGSGVTTTWCARLKPDLYNTYRFHCCAAWELTDERFTDKEFYLRVIRTYAEELSNKIVPVLK